MVNIANLTKMNSLEDQLEMNEHLQSQIQNVENSVQDISSQLDQKLSESTQKQQWVQGKEYTIKDSDIEENTINIAMNWSLKELKQDEKVLFLYREHGENEWIELEVEQGTGLNYHLEHPFSLKRNYESQIMAVSKEGRRREDLFNLNLNEQIKQRMHINAFVYQAGNGMFDVNVDIENILKTEFPLTNNTEQLRIKSAKATLLYNGQVLRKINLLEDSEFLQHEDYMETLHYNSMLNLEDEVGNEIGDVELHVNVQDELGFIYKTIGLSEK